MTYTLFLQIEDDTKLDPADRLVRVAAIDHSEFVNEVIGLFNEVLDTYEQTYGWRPEELDT